MVLLEDIGFGAHVLLNLLAMAFVDLEPLRTMYTTKWLIDFDNAQEILRCTVPINCQGL